MPDYLGLHLEDNLNDMDDEPIPAFIDAKAQINDNVRDRNHHHHDSLPIDVVCVIDHSGRMSGEKIEFVKEALKDMIDLLHHEDRICFVEFDNRVNRVTPLVRVSPPNKKRMQKLIDSIEANGRTNIDLGMRKALNVLKNRRYRQIQLQGFFYLGSLDEGAEKRVANSLAQLNLPDFLSSIAALRRSVMCE